MSPLLIQRLEREDGGGPFAKGADGFNPWELDRFSKISRPEDDLGSRLLWAGKLFGVAGLDLTNRWLSPDDMVRIMASPFRVHYYLCPVGCAVVGQQQVAFDRDVAIQVDPCQ